MSHRRPLHEAGGRTDRDAPLLRRVGGLAQGAAHPNPNPKHDPNLNPNPNPTPNPTSTPNQAPLTVLADTLVVEWSHRPTSLHMQEHFGYAWLG